MKKAKNTLANIALIVGASNNVQGIVEKTVASFAEKKTAIIYTDTHRKAKDWSGGFPTYNLRSIFPEVTDPKNIHAGPIAKFAMEHQLENIILCTEGITNLGLVESLAYNVTGENWQPFEIHKHHPAGGHVYNLREKTYVKV